MHRILMWLGRIGAALGIFLFVMVAISSAGQGGAAVLGAIGVGGGLIQSGAVLYSFGAIVEHLIAI